jgi:hypothetical protein
MAGVHGRHQLLQRPWRLAHGFTRLQCLASGKLVMCS